MRKELGYKWLHFSYTWQKISLPKGKAKNGNLLILLVPEVGIPSIYSGQAHRHGVEAPRDFECKAPSPYHFAIDCYCFISGNIY